MWQKIKSFLFENKTAKQTVAKNTVWLSISNFGGRIIKATIIIYGARVLGAAGYGVFSYAVTLAGFFTLFVDPGINAVLVREGAKATPGSDKSLFATTLIMKAVIIAASVDGHCRGRSALLHITRRESPPSVRRAHYYL